MALSDVSLLEEASSRQIRLAPKGCTLVSSDGNSGNIGGLHNLDRGGGMLQSAGFAEGSKLSKKRLYITTDSELTAGCYFNLSLLR
jgi:hypothetical protein